MRIADWFPTSRQKSGQEQHTSSEAQKPPDFCASKFPEVWSSFVNSLADFGFAGQPCGTPEQAGVVQDFPTQAPPAERVIAVGDLHGDFKKTQRAFRLAGLTDENDRWVGGNTVCVQVGDILDRGDNEIQICYFLERLQAQALKAGGKLYVLNGNHEVMTIMGNTRYSSPGASVEIARWQQWQKFAEDLKSRCRTCNSSSSSSSQDPNTSNGSSEKGGGGLDGLSFPASPSPALLAQQGSPGSQHFLRVWAFQPGSVLTRRFFANHPTVLQVGSTVFVHGGVLPEHVSHGFEKINRETRRWMLGEQALPSGVAASLAGAASGKSSREAPSFLRGASAIVWARDYSAEQEAHCECDKLKQVLESLPGASRMVMGHTIQGQGINSACEGSALRVDVGMSKGCGNRDVEVLEMRNDGQQVWRLREGQKPTLIASASSEGGRQGSNNSSSASSFLRPMRQQVAVSG
uniref:Calcineurin-like phosphoesterase domain-containing protein n=1 Tax=Dunaliella tertiolecta TaxID=3047 RepID=A0A7S3QZA2_DUNTE|mmetsp:Transcript_17903/g.46853  ORF Transcript_17903/g.46853 Transcript_17903/m.46853 type:complete len:462 (-) Transcript_17903:495-1880(-)|eukprot:CAMPEP_0202349256 /NCGR_PEP_ID=MMETSP1126-20121109/6822_1 /ASSEMBLY_ACC=CAM_ASM_000457 /TAXON_ID=3047 /ORGANISM="Dunaliella tertiolecta, Strain CCMP1320" /LENGTH=461 /DNA_ID=CAMNT_0048941033 /DNA_START=60 /DNA_END=1445 /DNA_ORIENTATION=-